MECLKSKTSYYKNGLTVFRLKWAHDNESTHFQQTYATTNRKSELFALTNALTPYAPGASAVSHFIHHILSIATNILAVGMLALIFFGNLPNNTSNMPILVTLFMESSVLGIFYLLFWNGKRLCGKNIPMLVPKKFFLLLGESNISMDERRELISETAALESRQGTIVTIRDDFIKKADSELERLDESILRKKMGYTKDQALTALFYGVEFYYWKMKWDNLRNHANVYSNDRILKEMMFYRDKSVVQEELFEQAMYPGVKLKSK